MAIAACGGALLISWVVSIPPNPRARAPTLLGEWLTLARTSQAKERQGPLPRPASRNLHLLLQESSKKRLRGSSAEPATVSRSAFHEAEWVRCGRPFTSISGGRSL